MKRLFLFAALGLLSHFPAAGADTLSCRILKENNWAFYGTESPTVKVSLGNGRKITEQYNIKCEIRDFLGTPLYDIAQTGSVAPLDSAQLSFTFKALEPGFYNVMLYNHGKFLSRVNLAKEPEKCPNALQQHLQEKVATGDFVYLANTIALQRRDLRPQFAIIKDKQLSGKEKNVYRFSMVSRGNERVTGYFAAPKEKKEHPLIITLVPLEERSANPLADFTAPFESAEMVVYLKQRGYGDDVVKNLLTDMLLAMDFAFNREEIRKTQVYLQGKGYAAACAMAASAMDDRIAGTFMESPDVSLLTASYSMESITKHIKAPLLLGTGLQRDTYSLQEIFSLYNSIKAPKEYFVVPDSKGIPRSRWKYVRDTFILRIQE